MNGAAGRPDDEERYARAALTYLAEPADRWLCQLIRASGAAATLEAIRRGQPGGDMPRRGIHSARGMRGAMERWRARLGEVPSPGDVRGFAAAGIRLVCPGDPEWPGQLAGLGEDQPYALWVRGNADLRFSCLRSVAVVGARAATAYGSYVAAEFAASLAARGWTVISGAAYGIDAAAHRGALGADGVTIAVLAGGVDTPYPAAHGDLIDAIAAQGAVVSEWPPGCTVSRLRFLIRNRVIAALATGTLVVEAGERSGALNTARHARDLDRRLMAVPGPVTSDQSAGCHRILRDWQGALVTSAVDVIEHLSAITGPPLPPDRPADPDAQIQGVSGISGAVVDEADASVPGSDESRTVIPLRARPVRRRAVPAVIGRDALDLQSATVLDAMPRHGGMATVRIAQRAGLSPSAAVKCLGELASGGFVERCEDGWRLRRT